MLVTLKLTIKVSEIDELTTTELLIKLACNLEVIVFTKQLKFDSLLMIVSQFWNLGYVSTSFQLNVFKSLETNSSTTSSLLEKKSQEKKIKNKI